MNNKGNNSILESLKINIAIDNFKSECLIEESSKIRKWKLENIKRTAIAIVCSCFLLASGITAAANYEKIINSFGFGKGLDKAVEDGYIAKPDMEYLESTVTIKNVNGDIIEKNAVIGLKVEDFLMDDVNLNTHFEIKIDEKVKKIISVSKLSDLQFGNIKITDEKGNRLDLESGINYFADLLDDNRINFTYNIYNKMFPKSTKLIYEIDSMILADDKTRIALNGNWKFEVNVPQYMYERTAIEYKVVSCDNSNFDVYLAKATDTGFEIGITISEVKTLENPLEDLYKEYNNGNITWEELENLEKEKRKESEFSKQYEEYLHSTIPIKIEIEDRNSEDMISRTSYIETDKKDKYFCSMSPGRKNNQNFTDSTTLDFYETFELTKKDATQKIKLRLMYNETPVIIELIKK